MKKLFAILAITGALVACNNDGEKKETTDSTTMTDTSSVVTPMPDTTTTMVDTTANMGDTTKK